MDDVQRSPIHIPKLMDVIERPTHFVRDAGGFRKTDAAFVEFIWADFFRRNIAVEDVTADFRAAVREAKRLAQSPLAKRIPGFIG